MAQKKKQHIIPKTYLKAFTDPTQPDGMPEHKPFEPSVWVIEKSLKSEPQRKSPDHRTFWKPYFYKLHEDSDSSPVIEEALSKIEGKYPHVLKKVCNREVLTIEELNYLALFIDTLFRRTQPSLEHWQSQINKLEELYRHVDQAHNQNQEISDEIWKDSHEIAKKLIIDAAGTLSSLILAAGLVFVFNQSELPFFSSDNPVTYQFGHIDDLYRVSIPKAWTYEDIGTNEQKFFCYCALTPTVAVVSSPFIRLPDEAPYAWVETKDPNFPFSMNILTHRSADSVLISHQPKPYGIHQDFAIQFLESIENAQSAKGTEFIIYTNKARYSLSVDAYEHFDTNPLQPEVHFWTKDLKTLHTFAQDDSIEVVHYYEDGVETGGTRYLKLYSVSLYHDEPSVMKAHWY
ncbi:MAG: DUF4238 domain-containing protein [Nostoc sp. NOS(2021)]|uniref:DUF4238 domain-containing protein n=1 Tax=Nostoc sp. NOS(2021) TaxID=2815407 RepID=UPI0025DDEDB4|nr:DUF4238 domain-containing protein [Nostoc sp. NOS(2021)]MBN3894364.1 DUF4238 domain-containing protein [Nostoc sp. NOS(2021)]